MLVIIHIFFIYHLVFNFKNLFLTIFYSFFIFKQVMYIRGAYAVTVGCTSNTQLVNKEKFECGGNIAPLQKYFEQKVTLLCPDLPCVWVGSRDDKNFVFMEVNIFFLM